MQYKELINFLDEHKINYSQTMLDKLDEYYELVIEWNQKINLTAITNKDEFYKKHFIDSLSPISYLSGKVCDIGSGAGFPGIVLAIFKPDISFTLIEPIKKRCTFLELVINKLNINNVIVLNKRSEELKIRETFDFVLSRAVAKLNILTEISFHLLKINGKAIFLKGDIQQEEITNANKTLNALGNQKFYQKIILDSKDYKRCLMIVSKTTKTDEKYPRAYNKIKNKPLK